MRISLVSTYTYPLALGLRYVSAFLKAQGHDVQMLFMRSVRDTAKSDFSLALLADFVERVRSADLVGMSLMTNTFRRACVLTDAIRGAGLKMPIVWGGPHPTGAVEESLEHADVACIGEGELPMLELADALEAGGDPTEVASMAFRQNGKTLRNDVAGLETDLNKVPFPDYDLDTHWVAMEDRFEPASPEKLRGVLSRYRIQSTRGCPFACAFCMNAAMVGIYKGKGPWVRKRSNESVIQELEQMRERYPTIEAVNIIDDLFFVRSEPEMEDFARLYKQRVDLPLELDAHPNTIDTGKIRALSSLPISLISMGIQSGCQETLDGLYERPTRLERIVDGINVLADHKIPAEYHYLVGNPFESDASRLETLRFAATHHRGPAILRIFPLQFYPGTPLCDRARAAGFIGECHESAYRFTYTGKTHLLGSGYLDIWLRVVLNLRNVGVPSGPVHALVTVVTSPAVRWVLNRKWFPPFVYGVYRVGRFIGRKLLYQPFVRPFRSIRRRLGRRKRPGADGPVSPDTPRTPQALKAASKPKRSVTQATADSTPERDPVRK